MARHKTGAGFARRFKILASMVRRNTTNIVQKAAIAADQAAVISTPVDTGRLRANWLVNIGSPADGEVDVGTDSLAHGRDVIKAYKAGKGAIYITNNVLYAAVIDGGSSSQAPHGMTARAIHAARKQLGSAKLLKGA